MSGGLATSGIHSKSIRNQPPHLIEGVVGIVFVRDGLASIRVVFGIDGVDCRVRMTSEDD